MVFKSATLAALATAQGAVAANLGSWGPSKPVPVSAAAAYVMPENGNVLMWSSGDPANFGKGEYHQTSAAIVDWRSQSVLQENITGAHSDMFCPGISVAFDGRVIITGGSSSASTTVHEINSGNNTFYSGPDMFIPRGYQAQTTLSDGRIFGLGGSWSGSIGGKYGEVWDLQTKNWRPMPGCAVEPMLTNDRNGSFRTDNHAWLFAWKDATVFQAGPSKAMNWYWPDLNGTTHGAGSRNSSDAMCGTATMWDATKGKILTAGGSPSYEHSQAVSSASILTIKDNSTNADVQHIDDLHYPRTLHNGVLLPSGEVVIVGGQSYAKLFSDENATTIPELWSPETKKWTLMADQGIGRTYHSWAVLLQDGTVMSGGGGLCRDALCVNPAWIHSDYQIFTPPYLLQADGKTPAVRPVIRSAPASVKLGDTFNIGTASPLSKPTISMVRLGSATHTVNTDQRRVPLDIVSKGRDASYTVTLPTEPGVMLPGYYFLFVMENGVPSVGQIVHVNPITWKK